MPGPHDGGGGCGRCCCSFILTSCLTALFLWLSLRPSKPTCSIKKFYVPALNTTDSSAAAQSNHTIDFNLKLANGMKDKGVHYANISINFYYHNSSSAIPIANYTVREFYQGHKKSTHRRDLVAATGPPWAAAREAVSNGTEVGFKVMLATRMRFMILFWYTRRYWLEVSGEILVDGSGNKVNKKNVKLKSGAAELREGPLLIFSLFIIFFL